MAITDSTYSEYDGIAAPSLSGSGKGRFYFDSTSNTFKFSENGSAYVNFPVVTSSAPVNVTKAAAVVGSATDAARSDHKHDITTATPGATAAGDTANEGTATSLARSDHRHSVATGTPSDIGTANAGGSATTFSRSDHVHNLPFTPVQTALGAASGAVSLNTQNLTSVGTLNGIRFYGVSATDPSSPAPANGDQYFNSVIHELMVYDGTRAKWLSAAQITIMSGGNGNTIVSAYFRGMDSLAYGTNIGHGVPKGTLVGLLYSMTTSVTSDIEVLLDTTVIATFHVTAAGLTSDLTLNVDFNQGLLKFRNKSTGATVINVQMVALLKRRI